MGCEASHLKIHTESTIQPVPNSQKPGFSHIYRKVGITELDYRPAEGINNILDLFNSSVQKHPNRTAISITVSI